MKRILLSILCLLLCLSLASGALAERSYLIPDSNTRALTEEELWTWNYESLGYILNEIFARHGYNFIAGGKYDYYFRCMPWYTPNANPNNHDACYSQLSRVEWDNEGLVKDVRAQMRALGTTNPSGKSVWDGFSTGFDTLQGFTFTTFSKTQTLPVYAAPQYDAWRGANGKACVSTNGNVMAAGWESGWLLVMYETNKGSVRVGYIPGDSINGNVDNSTQLSFDATPATVTTACKLTDDPARRNATIVSLPQGATVTYLTTYFNANGWDYVETTVDGQLVRGFVPSGGLDISATEDWYDKG